MATLRHTPPDRALSEAEVKFLLGGFDVLPASLDDLPEPERTRIIDWFLDDVTAVVFEGHREFLHAEAKRLGIRPVYRHPTGDYFYAERMPPGGKRCVTDDGEDDTKGSE